MSGLQTTHANLPLNFHNPSQGSEKGKQTMHDIAGHAAPAKSNPTSAPKKSTVTVRIEPDGRTKRLAGRAAWMARVLIKAGARGVTTVELPAGIRVSHAVYLLRREGFVISMQREAHGGEFSGVHGRFRIETPCSILEDATSLVGA